MAANANDVFMEVGSPGTATTLSSPGYTAGVSTSINVGSTTNWPTDTGVIFAIDEVTTVNGEQVRVEGTYNEFEGTVASATQITNVNYVGGDAERSYPAGATTRVYIPVSAERENRIISGLRAEHSQLDGTHKGQLISSRSETSTAPGDYVLFSDVSDSNNLKKVTLTNLIPADVVTTTMLQDGLIAQRQGGTTGNNSWYSSGSSNTATDAKRVIIQVGVILADTDNKTITFPTPFAQVPIVFASVVSANATNAFVNQPVPPTTTQATFRCINDAGGLVTTEAVAWMAVGQI